MTAEQKPPATSRFVFTGGPGAGKTTVLDALRARGFRCVPETARGVIQERLAGGLSPRPEPAEFARVIFEADMANYRSVSGSDPCYFDRGVIDALGMVHQCGPLPDAEIEEILRRYPYNPMVFLFPPWEEIYRTDSERDQTFPEAVRVFESLRRWYERCGYEPREVPFGSVAARVEFVERWVAEVLTPRP